MVNRRTHEICPVCSREGSGLYPKTVKNNRGKLYRYNYFAHKLPDNRIKWCYVGKTTKGSAKPRINVGEV